VETDVDEKVEDKVSESPCCCIAVYDNIYTPLEFLRWLNCFHEEMGILTFIDSTAFAM
jgi:hypothetical protein